MIISNLSVNCAWCYVSMWHKAKTLLWIHCLWWKQSYCVPCKEASSYADSKWSAGTSCSQISDIFATQWKLKKKSQLRIIDPCFIDTHFVLLRVISRDWSLSQHAVGGRQETLDWLPIHCRESNTFTSFLSCKLFTENTFETRIVLLCLIWAMLLSCYCPLIHLPLLSSNYLEHHLHVQPNEEKSPFCRFYQKAWPNRMFAHCESSKP